MKRASFNFELSASDEFVVVKPTGSWTALTGRAVADAARTRATELGLTRILIDMREAVGPDSDFTRFDNADYMAQTMRRDFRIAALATADMLTGFGETVARNRGVNFRIFADEDAAVSWLTTPD